MNSRHEELIAGYLDGALSEGEETELLEALRSDPELVGALAEELEIHRALQFAALPRPEGGERDADRILQFVRASLDGTSFLDQVKERALAEGLPDRKEPRHRSHASLRRRKGLGPPSFALPIGVAAALLMALLVLATLSKPGKTPSPSRAGEGTSRGEDPREDLRRVQDEADLRERERRDAEGRLAALDRERKRLAEERRKAEEDKQEELRKKAEEAFARTQAEFEDAQKKLALAREEERRAKENLSRPRPPGNPDLPKRETQTETLRASLEHVEGQVFVLSGTRKFAARAGQTLASGDGLETGAVQSRAVVRYEDGTLIELGAAGTIRGFGDRGGLEEAGKRIDLARGALKAEVTPQPQGRALVIATPHGEARVLGTTLRVVIETNATRLEVSKGRVRLTRHPDGKSVDVTEGHFSVAASGVDLAAWRLPPDVLTVNFGPAGLKLPDGVWNDSGEPFDPNRGYGWKGPMVAAHIPGTTFGTDPATGKKKPFTPQRLPGVSQKELAGLGPLRASHLCLGWFNHAEIWTLPVPNGRYLVTVSVGSAEFEHGPHHVAVEGKVLIHQVLTRPGEFHEAKDVPVEVKDGEVTMHVGGYFTNKVASDGSSDTFLNYLILKKVNGK